MGIRTQLMMVLCESALTSVRRQAQSRCPPKKGWPTGWSQIIQLQLSETCWDNRTCTVSKIRSHSPRKALQKAAAISKKPVNLQFNFQGSQNSDIRVAMLGFNDPDSILSQDLTLFASLKYHAIGILVGFCQTLSHFVRTLLMHS